MLFDVFRPSRLILLCVLLVIGLPTLSAEMGSAAEGQSAAKSEDFASGRLVTKALLPGAEIQVNATILSSQRRADLAMDSAGRFLAVWQSGRGDSDSSLGIRSQLFDTDGTPLGTEKSVNSEITGLQTLPAVAALPAGFAVVWVSDPSDGANMDAVDVQLRLLDADGFPLGIDQRVNTFTADRQNAPAIAADGAGNFVVVWQSEGSGGDDGSSWSVQAQRFDAAGLPLGTETQVNVTTAGGQLQPDVAMTSAGDFVIAWRSQNDIVVRRFDSAGVALEGEILVDGSASVQQRPRIAVDPMTGEFVVAWQSTDVDGDGEGIRARRFDASGSPLGSEIAVNAFTVGDQTLPRVALAADGSFTIVWTDATRDSDGSSGIYARRFAADDTPLEDDFQVHLHTPDVQEWPAIVSTSDGDLVIAWESLGSALNDTSGYGILARRFEKARADLAVAASADRADATPGDEVELTVTVSHGGGDDLSDVTVEDTLPPALADASWVCSEFGGASCSPESGTDSVSLSADLPAASSLETVLSARVAGGTPPGTLTYGAEASVSDLVDSDPSNDSDSVDIEILATDFGDAPPPFPTLAADDGARHVIVSGISLNGDPDAEADGQPESDARGDDPDALDDDGDGVTWPVDGLVACAPATAQVFVLAPAGTSAFLNAWVDFDSNGAWSSAEQIFTDEELFAGSRSLSFSVPCDAVATPQTFARVRLSSAGGDGIVGRADDGEVEDYAVAILSRSDLEVTKTLDTDPPVPGTAVQYIVTVTNDGPSPASAEVDDAFPGLVDVEWTCAGTGSATCAASGTGALVAEPVTLPPGESVTFTATGDLDAGATGTLSNTATATLISGTDPDPGDNVATVSATMQPTYDLAITKTNGQDVAVLNDSTTYTITIANPSGPSHAIGALVDDAFTELSGATWTCVAEGGASCTPSGSGPLVAESVDLPIGGSVTFTATGTVTDVAPVGEISNTATVSPAPGAVDPNLGDNTATDTDPLAEVDYGDAPDCTPQPDCGAAHYPTLLVNDGARHAIVPGISLDASPDAENDGRPGNGANGDDGDGFDDEDGIDDLGAVLFVTGETALLDIVTVVDSGQLGGVNTGYLSGWIDFNADGDWDDPGEQVFTDVPLDDGTNRDLAVAVPIDAVPGVTYLRLRFSTETGLGVRGFAPDGEIEDYKIQIYGLDYGDAEDCEPRATCGPGYPTLRSNNGARHVERGGIFLGATIDAETNAQPTPAADGDDTLGIPDDEDGVTFLATPLEPLTMATVQVTVSSECDERDCLLQAWIDWNGDRAWSADEKFIASTIVAAGDHEFTFEVPEMPVTGADVIARFRISSQVDLGPDGLADDGEVEDHAVAIVPVANLAITKTIDAPPVPGTTVTYTVTVSNPGPNDVTDVIVVDSLPPVLDAPTWTCVGTSGSCAASGSGDIDDSTVSIDAGGSVTYTITGTLVPDAEAQLAGSPLVNTASASVPDGFINLDALDRQTVSVTAEDEIVPTADLAVLSVNDGTITAVPGTELTYQVQVANLGPGDAPGARVLNTAPELLGATATWTCTPVGGAVCPTGGTGTPGALIDVSIDLPAGSSATFQVTSTIDPSATGTITNIATITPPATVTDPEPSNDSAADLDTVLTPRATLRLDKIDAIDPIIDGAEQTYTVTVTNEGPSDAVGVVVTDSLPGAIPAASTAGCVEDPAGLPECTLGTIAPGLENARSFTVTGAVVAALTESIDNTVSVAASTTLLPPPPDDPAEATCIYPRDGEFPLTVEPGAHSVVDVATGASGSVAVWQSTSPEPSIMAQRLDVDGIPVGEAVRVDTLPAANPSEPAVAVTADGRFIVAWRSAVSPGDDDESSILARRFAADATPVDVPFQVNDFITGTQRRPSVALAADGTFYVAWESLGSPGDDNGTFSVQGRLFDAAGVPAAPQDQLNSAISGGQERPRVAYVPADTAGFVATWQSESSVGDDAGSWSIQARWIDLGGALGPEIQANMSTTGQQVRPAIDANGEGLVAIAWQSDHAGGNNVYARRFEGTLSPTSGEVLANGLAAPATSPAVALGEDRNLTIAWESADAGGLGIYRRSFAPDGTAFDVAASQVNVYETGDQRSPRIGQYADGDYLVIWQGPSSDCRPGLASVVGRFEEVFKADLSISITDADGNSSTTVTPGVTNALRLELVATNSGDSDVEDARITAELPDLVDSIWSCSDSGGAACPDPLVVDGTVDPLENIEVALPVGGSVLFLITGTLDSSAREPLPVPASIVIGSGVSDPDIQNNQSSVEIVPAPEADLGVTKSVTPMMATAGESCDDEGTAVVERCLTYKIVASNAGPSDVVGAEIFDPLSPDLVGCNLACTASGGASCTSEQPTFAPDEIEAVSAAVDLPVGSEVTYTLECDISSSATSTVENEVEIRAPLGVIEIEPEPGESELPDRASATVTLENFADLALEKTGPDEVQVGDVFSYTLTVTNLGPSAARDVQVVDNLPEGTVLGVSSLPGCTVLEDRDTGLLEVTCTATAPVPAGTSIDFEIPVELTLGADEVGDGGVVLANAATTSATTSDPDSANNIDTFNTNVRPDFLVNTTSGKNLEPAVAADAAGNFYIVWDADILDGNQRDIRLRRYSNAGAPVGTESVLNALRSSDQTKPQIAIASTGEALVVWESAVSVGSDSGPTKSIQGVFLDAAGQPIGNEFQVNELITTGDQLNPDVAAVTVPGAGGALETFFWVVWDGQGPEQAGEPDPEGDILLRRFKADGTRLGMPLGDEERVNTYTSAIQRRPRISVAENDTVVIAWESIGSDSISRGDSGAPDTSGSSVQARRYAFDGTPLDADDFQLNAVAANDQRRPAVAAMPGGEFFALWESDKGSPAGGFDIQGRFFCRDGLPAEGELKINPPPPPGEPDGDQTAPALSFLGEEDFLFTWRSSRNVDDPSSVIDRSFIEDKRSTEVRLDQIAATQRFPFGPGLPEIAEATNILLRTPDVAFFGSRYLVVWENRRVEQDGSGTVVEISELFARLSSLGPPPQVIQDEDGDTVVDSCDRCPGIDDTIDTNGNRIPDCAEVDLAITKSSDSGIAIPGETVTYMLTVTNNGPGDALGAVVEDLLPDELSNASWQCLAIGNALCESGVSESNTASGTGDPNLSVDIEVGAQIEITIEATLDVTASGDLTNTATVSASLPQVDLAPGDNDATVSDTIEQAADLWITKTDGQSTDAPGTSISYTLVVGNNGPADVVDARVIDVFPAALQGVAWTCSGTGEATCQSSGTGDLDELVDLPVGNQVTFNVVGATIDSTATGTLENTATVSPPAGIVDPVDGNDSATDSTALVPSTDLSITKDDGLSTVVAGDEVTYTIVVSNNGPSMAIGARVIDSFPPELENPSWRCVSGTGGATCPSASTILGDLDQVIDLPVGATLTFEAYATLSSSAMESIANTARVDPAPDADDPVPGNNEDTDQNSVSVSADLAIVKTDGQTSAVPGESLTYTLTVTNAGPSNVTGATVSDEFPPALSCETPVGCTGSNGAICDSVSLVDGALAATLNVPMGGQVDLAVTCTVDPAATGFLINTASVGGVFDPAPGNNLSTDSNTLTPTADLEITKTNGTETSSPGAETTYTIVVTNHGPSAAPGTRVVDDLTSILENVTWTCTASGSASCVAGGAAGSGIQDVSGNIDRTVDLPIGESVTILATGTIPAGATGSLSNTATVSPAAGVSDPGPKPNAATDEDALAPEADLFIAKTNGTGSVVAGEAVQYTLTVTNAGPADIVGARVFDDVPAILENVSWTCEPADPFDPRASCTTQVGDDPTADGGSDIDRLVDLRVGGTLIFTIDGTLASSAIGRLTNTATVSTPTGVTDPDPADDSDTDDDPIERRADLAIQKTGPGTVQPGGSVSYTLVVTNAGPSDASAQVEDVFPSSLENVSWTCTSAGGASCGTPTSGSGDIGQAVEIPVGGSVTFQVDATVLSSVTESVTNTATVTADSGVTDPDDGDDSSSVTSTLQSQADLSITKTNGVDTVVPGTSVTYTIVASNPGPSDALGATVTDPFPPEISSVTWDCVPAGGASCVSGSTNVSLSNESGDISQLVDLPAGSSVTFTVIAEVSPAATGTLENTATVSAPAGVNDPSSGNDSATDSDSLPPEVDLSVVKACDSPIVPGSSVSCTVMVSNIGPSDAPGSLVSDSLPAALVGASWACTPTGGASCPLLDGVRDLAAMVDLPLGSSVTFTFSATVDPAALGMIENTAGVSAADGIAETQPGDNSSTAMIELTPMADLSVVKTNGVDAVAPGASVTYTITVANAGPNPVAGARLTDSLPASLTNASWTCAVSPDSAGGACGPGSDGSGTMVDASLDLPVGGEVVITLVTTVASDPAEPVENTASVAPPVGVMDPVSENDSSTDSDSVISEVNLAISKTADVSTADPGDPVVYTIEITNATGLAQNAKVNDTLPVELTNVTWTCASAGNAACSTGSGTGNLVDVFVDIGSDPGDLVTFTVSATIDSAIPDSGTVENMASVSAPDGVPDSDSSDNQSTAVILLEEPFFADGFESGDTTAWSSATRTN